MGITWLTKVSSGFPKSVGVIYREVDLFKNKASELLVIIKSRIRSFLLCLMILISYVLFFVFVSFFTNSMNFFDSFMIS